MTISKQSLAGSKGVYRLGLLVPIVLVAAAVLFLAPLGEAAKQDFTLSNLSGEDIVKVFIDPSNNPRWEGNVLVEPVLNDGYEVEIYFNEDEDEALWDLRIIFADGTDLTYSRLDLLDIKRITVYKDSIEF